MEKNEAECGGRANLGLVEGAGLRVLAKIVRGSLTMEMTFEQRLAGHEA